MLADAVAERLHVGVAALADRVETALSLAEMLRRKALPNYTPAAFVVPNGIAGRAAEFSENIFVQAAEEIVSVVLVVRTAGDVRGARTQASLQTLIWSVIFALCGWSPPPPDDDQSGTDPVGVLELRRGRINSLDAGTVFYQLDFAIAQQVRIVS